MNPQRYDSQQSTWTASYRTAENAKPEPRDEWRDSEARRAAEMAARSVMHPDSSDREWRYYHGTLGG